MLREKSYLENLIASVVFGAMPLFNIIVHVCIILLNKMGVTASCVGVPREVKEMLGIPQCLETPSHFITVVTVLRIS